MKEENFIGQFLDNLDVNTRAYHVLLFILGVLIAMTLYANHKIRSQGEIGFLQNTECTIINPILN